MNTTLVKPSNTERQLLTNFTGELCPEEIDFNWLMPVVEKIDGLYDYDRTPHKHGKEIYEGDVIRWRRGYSDDSVFDLWPQEPYIVKFEHGKFFMHCAPNGPGGYVLGFDSLQNKEGIMTQSEVIGHIYSLPSTTKEDKE